MDTQTQAALQAHLDGIAAILIQEADPNDLQTWAGREKSVRALAQHHVLPELGIFLSTVQQRENLENPEL